MANIIVLTRGFPPLNTYGGPAISINNLVENLKEHNFLVVANSYELGNNITDNKIKPNNFINYSENTKALYLDKSNYNLNFIIEKLESDFNPDLIYANSFFDYVQLRVAIGLKNNYNIPLLIAPRGELEEGAMKHKKSKYLIKELYIKLFLRSGANKNDIYFQSTSREEFKSIQNKIGVDESQIVSLQNIPTFDDGHVSDRYKKENLLNIIFLSRIQIKKNLSYALKTMLEIDLKFEINFHIYGPIENNEYWEECLEIIKKMPDNIKVEYKGVLNHDEVSKTMGKYDLFYLPTMSENFGHVIFEALNADTLILISDQTPWTDINESESGVAIGLEEPDKFVLFIEKIASLTNLEYEKMIKKQRVYLENKINIEAIVSEYDFFFHNLSKNNNLK